MEIYLTPHNILGKSFIFDGVAIPYSASEGIAQGWIADFDWSSVATRNSELNRQDFHGVISNPTFANGRLIAVSGEIFSTEKSTRGSVRKTVQDTFKIEDFPVLGSEFKKLEFTDDDDSEWFINAKVRSVPTFDNDRADPIITFQLYLFAEDPLIRSKALQEVSGIYGLYGGVRLPVELPVDLGFATNPLTVLNSGNFSSPPKITVTGEITNPKVLNLTTGRFFSIAATMTAGDELIIDTDLITAKLNGVNVLADRVDGSNWIFLSSGTNFLVLMGDDFDYDDQSKATIKVEYYNTRL